MGVAQLKPFLSLNLVNHTCFSADVQGAGGSMARHVLRYPWFRSATTSGIPRWELCCKGVNQRGDQIPSRSRGRLWEGGRS